jgi:putative pyruvate formate lyase activating enzyme
VEPGRAARDFGQAVASGVRYISLIGGEATLHLPAILQIAAASEASLPIVINSNMYMTPEVLELLDGVVSVYLADFKFGNDSCAERIAGVPRYCEVVERNLLLAASSTAKVIVRHVLIPGHMDCCFRPIVDWVSRNLPGNRFQLYTGYVPCWRAKRDPEIGRLNSRVETDEALDYLRAANVVSTITCDAPTAVSGSGRLDASAELGITIGVDGRVYCHDLTPELAQLLGSLFPSGGDLRCSQYVQVGVNAKHE